ncbi:MAG: hypothetical protein ACOYOP_02095 [Microthrixaceae bacterium]
MRTTFAAAVAALALTTVISACGPMPPPSSSPVWQSTARNVAATPAAPYTATTANWWVVVRIDPTNGLAVGVDIYRRSGVNGEPAATPTQSIAASGGVVKAVAMTDRVIGVASSLFGQVTVGLLRYDDVVAQWVPTTAFVPSDPAVRGTPNSRVTLSVTDTAVALGLGDASPGAADGRVVVQRITATPTSLTTGTAQVIGPDPAWTSEERAGFGQAVSLEGGTLAVSDGRSHVVLYRAEPATVPFAVDATLTPTTPPSSSRRFGTSLSVDTSTGAPRVLVGSNGDAGVLTGTPYPGSAVVWTRASGAWTVEADLPAPTTGFAAATWGGLVSLDGARAAVGFDLAAPSGAPADFRVTVWALTGAPTPEATLSAGSALTVPAGATQLGLTGLQLAGSHLSTVAIASGPSGTTSAAVSWDRIPPA